jgi:hypothetical protein
LTSPAVAVSVCTTVLPSPVRICRLTVSGIWSSTTLIVTAWLLSAADLAVSVSTVGPRC